MSIQSDIYDILSFDDEDDFDVISSDIPSLSPKKGPVVDHNISFSRTLKKTKLENDDALFPKNKMTPEEIKIKVIQEDPNYQFMVTVAGFANLSVADLYEEHGLASAMTKYNNSYTTSVSNLERTFKIYEKYESLADTYKFDVKKLDSYTNMTETIAKLSEERYPGYILTVIQNSEPIGITEKALRNILMAYRGIEEDDSLDPLKFNSQKYINKLYRLATKIPKKKTNFTIETILKDYDGEKEANLFRLDVYNLIKILFSMNKVKDINAYSPFLNSKGELKLFLDEGQDSKEINKTEYVSNSDIDSLILSLNRIPNKEDFSRRYILDTLTFYIDVDEYLNMNTGLYPNIISLVADDLSKQLSSKSNILRTRLETIDSVLQQLLKNDTLAEFNKTNSLTSGEITIKPKFHSAILKAYEILKIVARKNNIIPNDYQFYQKDPNVMPIFAELVALFMIDTGISNPNQYVPVSVSKNLAMRKMDMSTRLSKVLK